MGRLFTPIQGVVIKPRGRPKKQIRREPDPRIVTLREQGWTYQRIADEIGSSESSVRYQCLLHCIEPPGVPAPPRIGRAQTYTPADDAQLIAFDAQGLTFDEMARRLGRGSSSVRLRFMTKARRDERGESRMGTR